MSSRTDILIKFLQVISWITFIGLCIQCGALIFNFIFTQFNPVAAKDLYLGLDLSSLFGQNEIYFGFLFSFTIVVTAIKAYLFFLITQIFSSLNLVKPFSEEISKLIAQISYYTFSIGLIGAIAHRYAQSLVKRGFDVDSAGQFWNDYSAFLMMAAVVFVIAQIFKKGLELQSENDLTV
ncbi:MAG: DUF2975 domain-containing protein [Algoriphagus sp.]|uniref:DUF2975 domain-containing protein n=1 Tax=Algoriphagus sp. TaxID=1872435 RepID=UPI00272EEE21|nr:DUF2975 domain-containing protein [Algoriphagus sp.]MDP2039721.1 DUF2975 domain-containing protein [Algoriphagus sp.]MDP3473780.1 DUF2975 domain-containing protein [Algoriphagus sp.]